MHTKTLILAVESSVVGQTLAPDLASLHRFSGAALHRTFDFLYLCSCSHFRGVDCASPCRFWWSFEPSGLHFGADLSLHCCSCSVLGPFCFGELSLEQVELGGILFFAWRGCGSKWVELSWCFEFLVGLDWDVLCRWLRLFVCSPRLETQGLVSVCGFQTEVGCCNVDWWINRWNRVLHWASRRLVSILGWDWQGHSFWLRAASFLSGRYLS